MELQASRDVVVCSMIFLQFKVGVILAEDKFGDIVEFRLIYLAGKLEVVLKLRDLLVLQPQFILLQGYFPEGIDLFLCEQDQLSLFGVRV